MTRRQQRYGSRSRQRGAVLAAVGVALGAFLALTVVGVDVARLAHTAAEVQAVADTTAAAGARALLEGGDVNAEGLAVAGLNDIDGTPAAPADLQIDVGNWSDLDGSPAPGDFTPGGTPTNAVRAIAHREVNNIWAGVLGDPTTTVTKVAVAPVGPPCSGNPLPLALGECFFPDDCSLDTPSECEVTQVHPSPTDNSAWTGFLGGSGQSDILGYFPSPCGGGNTATISIGDEISLNNGEITPLFSAVRCLVCQADMREFLLPVIECPNGNFIQTQPVTGFATVIVNRLHYTQGSGGEWRGPDESDLCQRGGAVDGIEWRSVVHAQEGGGVCLGAPYGTFVTALAL